MKVIIKHIQYCKTPIKVYEVEDLEDAWDLIDEAHQCFGQGIILTDEEFKDIVNQNHINEVKTIKVDDKFTTNECGTITNWWVVEQNDLGIVLDNDSPRFSKFELGLKEFMKKVKVGDFVPVEKWLNEIKLLLKDEKR